MPRDVLPPMAQVKDSTTFFGAKFGNQGAVYPGGLDLLTPNLSLHPGALRDCSNFEIALSGGYDRISGYERFNGMAAPHEATFVIVQVSSFTNVPAVGDEIEQASSGASGVVALVNDVAGAYYMVVTDTTGTFDTSGAVTTPNNSYTVTEAGGPLVVTSANSPFVVPQASTAIGTATTVTVQLTAALNAQYQVAAADIYRDRIDPVPGAGPILGVVHMIFDGVDNVYAFRANDAGTAVDIWASSATGWTNIPLNNLVSFTAAGTAEPMDGDTLIQGPATATIRRVMVNTGTIAAGTAAGSFVVTTPNFGFTAGAATTSSGATLTLSGPQTAIVLTPGGRFEFVKCNFSGQLVSRAIYGCDGVNPAFEFDGTTLSPITTGLSPNVPSHIAYHKSFLVLSQGSSIITSAPGDPFRWTSTDGAAEIATGDQVNAMLTLPGAQTTATLGVWMRNTTGILYGTDLDTFNFVLFNVGVGAVAGSVQNLFDTFAFAEPGVYNLQTTLNFGNFNAGALTKNIQPFINQQRSKITCSGVSHTKGQYRVFFNDGYGLWLSIANQQYLGPMLVQYPNPVNCVDVDTSVDGDEVGYFGSNDDDGYIYQLDVGPNFDGENLTAYLVCAWDYLKTPRWLKQYRCASVEMAGSSYAAISFSYGLNDNSPLIGQPTATSYTSSFSPAVWDDSVNWDNFFWDGQTVSPTYVDLTGTAYDVQPIISSGTNYIASFNISTLIYQYSIRRRLRGM